MAGCWKHRSPEFAGPVSEIVEIVIAGLVLVEPARLGAAGGGHGSALVGAAEGGHLLHAPGPVHDGDGGGHSFTAGLGGGVHALSAQGADGGAMLSLLFFVGDGSATCSLPNLNTPDPGGFLSNLATISCTLPVSSLSVISCFVFCLNFLINVPLCLVSISNTFLTNLSPNTVLSLFSSMTLSPSPPLTNFSN